MTLRDSGHALERRKAITKAELEINRAIDDAYDKHTLSEGELLLILSNKIGQMATWAIRQDNKSQIENEHG
jgi:hypothetical protein